MPREPDDRLGTCVFCGFQGSLEGEHVFPAWLRRQTGTVGNQKHRFMVGSDFQLIHKWHKPMATHRVWCTCHNCNHGWMKDLEDRAMPLLAPLARMGLKIVPTGDACRTIAAWTLKTLAVAQEMPASPVKPIGTTERHNLRLLGQAPKTTTVWLLPGLEPQFDAVSLLATFGQGQREQGYVGWLQVGRTLLVAVGLYGFKPQHPAICRSGRASHDVAPVAVRCACAGVTVGPNATQAAGRRRRSQPGGELSISVRRSPRRSTGDYPLHVPPNLADRSHAQLLSLYASVLRELQQRGVVRTSNAPAGDYAEYLIAQLVQGELAPNSEKTWDLRSATGRRIQVKCRIVADPANRGQRQLSPFRSFDFDDLAIVLLSPDYSVWRAALIPVETARAQAVYRQHVNGHIVFASDRLLTGDGVTDVTDQLRALASETAH